MTDLRKLLNNFSLKKEKIVFCYLEFDSSNYTPLDLGYVLAILKKEGMYEKYNFEIFRICIPRNNRVKSLDNHLNEVADSILALKPKAVFFFSDNVISSLFTGAERVKKIALKIKEKNHKIFIGLQGSRLDSVFIQKLLATRKIDCVIHDNPEEAFLSLESILKKEKVSNVIRNFSEIQVEKSRCYPPGAKRVEKEYLDEKIPSVYLSGIMDNVLSQKRERVGVDASCFIQSSRGCVFGCYYCSRSIKFESVRCFSPERFYDEVEYLISKFGFFRFFVIDDAFIIFKKKLLDFRREFEKRKLKNEKLKNIKLVIMARIESLDEEIISILKDLNVIDIQIGLQTINPALQHYMNRKADLADFISLAEKLKEAKIKFLVDIIAGLPNDTIEWFEKTLDFVVDLHPNRIQINQFSLAPETLFYKEKERFGIKKTKSFAEFRRLEILCSNGIDEVYYTKVYAYIKSKNKEHQEIAWFVFFHGRRYCCD